MPEPEWCIVGTLPPYPYRPGPHEAFRSQKIFPAGAKLHLIGGYAGMGYDSVFVVGYGHHRRNPVGAVIDVRLAAGWRTELVYRPAILRRIHAAQAEDPGVCHRWAHAFDGALGGEPYRAHLEKIAAGFQRRVGS
jgi:hypothetical protein